MPTNAAHREPSMPVRAGWMLNDLKEPMRSRALLSLQKTIADNPDRDVTIEDVQAAISKAFAERGHDEHVAPNHDMWEQSLQAFREGRSKPIQECFHGVSC